MKTTLNWREYLIEAWALGMFMISALAFTILLEHPASMLRQTIESAFVRRMLGGIAMGLTAVCLIYSPWGKRSGAHMNPAVTLTHWQLNRIKTLDAIWYILAQTAGGSMAVWLFYKWSPVLVAHPSVNFVVTVPGPAGVPAAFASELFISALLMTVVLQVNNRPALAPYTGYFAGTLVALFITFEAPFSGMSMNPARTFASAVVSGNWTAWWLYLTAPLLGMLSAGYVYRWSYRSAHDGDCSGIRCHQSGAQYDNPVYDVLYKPRN